MDRPTWWLQLLECTAFEKHADVRRAVRNWLPEEDPHVTGIVNWVENTALPLHVSIAGDMDCPPVDEWCDEIQMYCTDREYMVLALVVDCCTISQKTVEYIVVTKSIVAKVSGEALMKRIKDIVMASEEDILAAPNSS